jgi:hypothetical protein
MVAAARIPADSATAALREQTNRKRTERSVATIHRLNVIRNAARTDNDCRVR